ncbi:MAG: DUF4160 domain-containing protein [Bacteroidales bacterium]|nr:DUF4160 domain-containing protein [Bacteroidales bacterium]MBN2821303.1 DUF4160 domain-containing protein [Bacteroidales bacterium]
MPKVAEFNRIKNYVYNGEHRPPHIHAIHNEFEVLLEIETGEIYAGDLPTRQFKMVSDWLSGNTE